MKLSDTTWLTHLRVTGASVLALLALPTAAEVISIGGSGSALGTMTLVARAFEKAHPEHTVKLVPALGSSGGIKALQAQALSIAVSNRDASAEEKAAGVMSIRYGSSPLVFAAHKQTPPIALTQQKLVAIYTGRETTWSNGQTLRLVLRPINDSDTQVLLGASADMKTAVSAAYKREGLVTALTDSDAVNQIESIAGSFGTTTLSMVLSEGRKVNVLTLNDVIPSVSSLANGTYPLFKDMYAIYRTSHTEGTKQFMQFFRSSVAKDILQNNGHRVY